MDISSRRTKQMTLEFLHPKNVSRKRVEKIKILLSLCHIQHFRTYCSLVCEFLDVLTLGEARRALSLQVIGETLHINDNVNKIVPK